MPTIRLPDGKTVRFPDDMPREEIRALIAFKFPETAPSAPAPNDLLMGLARQEAQPNPASQPRLEGNQFASSLPGPLGQFQNSTAAMQAGFTEGMTGNLSNEIVSGLGTPIETAVMAAQGKGFDPGQAFNNLYEYGQAQNAGQQALNPEVYNRGNIAGATVLGAKLGSFTPRATTPLGMAGLGAVEGGAYGAVYGFGGAEGNDRYMEAAKEGAIGALTGGAIGFGAGNLTQPVSKEARIISRGLEADRIPVGEIPQRTAALGPSGMIADIGPTLQGQTAAIATTPGQGSRDIVDALSARRAGANSRIRGELDSALGPAPRLSQVEEGINASRKAVNAQYEPVFLAKSLSNDPFMDVSPVLSAIDNRLTNTVGDTKATLSRVRSLLLDGAGNPIQDPQMVMAVRQELDGLIGTEQNRTIKGALSEIRKAIDGELATAVPGLKAVDSQFAEIAKQGEALETGRTILDSGKNAVDPADLVEQVVNNSPGQNLRLSEGARAEINRLIGTNANDRVALQRILKGEGSWNYEKLRTVFGDQKAQQLTNIIDREATMAATENLATAGSRTQVLKAAQDDILGQTQSRGAIQEALNFQYGNAAARMADKVLGGALEGRRAGVVNNVARALLGPGLDPRLISEIVRLTSGASKNEAAVLAALQASQAAD